MQTFLPYPDCSRSAAVLDDKRLGKQRLEVKQILAVLRGERNGWKNHPAIGMWWGYDNALAVYGNCCIVEWLSRGYENKMEWFPVTSDRVEFPKWWGNPITHLSYQELLLSKDFLHYSGMFNGITVPNDRLIWPIHIASPYARKLNGKKNKNGPQVLGQIDDTIYIYFKRRSK